MLSPILSVCRPLRRMLALLFVCGFVSHTFARSLVKADIQLANNAVLAMHQDRRGNLWIGTYDGLHLYNGKNTFVFRMELDNEYSLCSNIVQQIVPADDDHLWLVTSLGINRFSLRERRVTESYMQYNDAENVRIAADAAGNALCFSGSHSVSCYRAGAARFDEVAAPGLRAADIAALWSEAPGSFCALLFDGSLLRYRLSDGAPEAAAVVCTSQRRLAPRPVAKAFYEQGCLYFVDEAAVLWRYDSRDDALAVLSDLSVLGDTGHTVSAVCVAGDEVWVGFFAGALGRLPASGGRCELVERGYRIFCLSYDRRQDLLWVGTDGYGVYMYCDRRDLFTSLRMEELPYAVNKPVRAIRTDSQGDLWIGTKGDGMLRIVDYRSRPAGGYPAGRVERFDRLSGLTSNEVFAFCGSARRDLFWIATSGPGLSYYSYKERRVRPLPPCEGAEPLRNAHQMCEAGDSTLYVASDTEGLVELTLAGGDTPRVVAERRYRFGVGQRDCNEFYALIRESDSTLLLGMRGGYGVIRFDIRTKRYAFVDMRHLHNRALGDVLCLWSSRRSGLYCGASSGLIRIAPDGEIRHYDRRDGMDNDMIHGVLEDDQGCIWLSTNKGVVQYNPRVDLFHRFVASEGTVSEFSDDAYWKSPNSGHLFFGGVDGVVWIDPAQALPGDYRPDLQFLDLTLSDGETRSLYDRTGGGARDEEPVEIPAHTSGFSVSFVAVDYLAGDNYEYSYLLEGRDEEWIDLRRDNRVAFTHLPPGDYRLRVRYRSSAMDERSRVYTLPLRVLPPWYRTGAACAGYVVAALLAAAGCVVLLRRHYRREQRRVVARIEEEQREKLSEARLNFFVNISHELCTPLTLINGMNERIAQLGASDGRMEKYTSVMAENVRGLNELIREILDFRKIEEAGFGRVRIRRVDIAGMLSAQLRSFADAADRNEIRLVERYPAALTWNTDSAFFRKIVANLLSNAMKYTPVGGRIEVSASAGEAALELAVTNTGRGIEPADLEHLFDRYRVLDDMDRNMYTASAPRHGLGLFICRGLVEALGGRIEAASEPGRSTTFTVSLPWREAEVDDGAFAAMVAERRPDPTANPANPANPAAPEPSASPAESSPASSSVASPAPVPVPAAEAAQPAGAPGRKPRVLVVDDNHDIVWLIESALTDDFEVDSCGSVAEALERLAHATPDLIVTDRVMAGADGLELIAAVRADKILRNIPVVVVSARISDAEQAEGLVTGADAYLTKPFSLPVFTATVRRLIESRRMLDDYYRAPESAYTVVEGQTLHRTEKEFMDAVAEAVQQHIESENPLELVAAGFGLTPRNFYRKFKRISGRTPSEFIKEYRFEHAARLLRTTDLTVQEIMYRVGISNKSYFYREFQAKYGMRPREYRSGR